MKNSFVRTLLLCILAAIVLGARPLSNNHDSVTVAGSSMVTPVHWPSVLNDSQLRDIVGGATGCSTYNIGALSCLSCCLDLWILEICVTGCIPNFNLLF